MKHNSYQILQCLMHWVNDHSSIILPNYYLDSYWECDLYRLNNKFYDTEYEIKVTKADFKKDFTKGRTRLTGKVTLDERGYRRHESEKVSKHIILAEGGRVNRFYFVVPEGLVTPDEVPKEFGLIYAIPQTTQYFPKYGFRIVRNSKLLKKTPRDQKNVYNLARLLTIKIMAAKPRLHNR